MQGPRMGRMKGKPKGRRIVAAGARDGGTKMSAISGVGVARPESVEVLLLSCRNSSSLLYLSNG